SLSTIARRYRTTADIIKQTNNLRSSRIHAGQSLIVPVAARSLTDYTLSADVRRYRPPIRGSSKRRQYVVRKGDSLWEIARRNRISVGMLARWNGISRGDPIRPGQKLIVRRTASKAKPLAVASTPTHGPSVATQTTQRIRYTVRRGDSLWNISRKFSVSIASLRRWNNINRSKHLQPGQKLDVYVDITGQAKSS
ncbi:MAG: lytic transglycosylase, partial [Gammaproteobacteria bacterium]